MQQPEEVQMPLVGRTVAVSGDDGCLVEDLRTASLEGDALPTAEVPPVPFGKRHRLRLPLRMAPTSSDPTARSTGAPCLR